MKKIVNVTIILLGIVLLFVSALIVTGEIFGDEVLSYRIKVFIVIFVLGVLILAFSIEPVSKRLSKTWDEILDEIRTHKNQKTVNIKTGWVVPFALFFSILGYILLPDIISRENIYLRSDNWYYLVWLGFFPVGLMVMFFFFPVYSYKKHKYKIQLIKIVFVAFLVAFSGQYATIIQDHINKEEFGTDVIIIATHTRSCVGEGRIFCRLFRCKLSAEVKDLKNVRHSFCIDSLKHNLVEGNVAYIDNGDAHIVGREGWLGVVVDSIWWKPQYTDADRYWSVEKQKHIYYNRN